MALALFATDLLRLDNAALLVFIVLLIAFAAVPYSLQDGGTYDPIRLLASLGNEALVAACALMVLGKGIETTRALLQPLITFVSRQWGPQPKLTMLVIMVVAAVLPAFMNNTPIVVLLLPALIAVARQDFRYLQDQPRSHPVQRRQAQNIATSELGPEFHGLVLYRA